MRYDVRVTTSETYGYHIEADSPEEAKELVISGDYDSYATIDSTIDNVEVVGESPDDVITVVHPDSALGSIMRGIAQS